MWGKISDLEAAAMQRGLDPFSFLKLFIAGAAA
jgi:hypothetical protein